MNQTKKKNPLKRLLSMRGMGQVVTVTIGLIVLLVAFALINPNFWSPTNRTNLLRQIAPDYRYCTVLCPYYRQY